MAFNRTLKERKTVDMKSFPTEQILVVDESDTIIGPGDKIDVHREGRLHRAFSVLIHDGSGRWLLQKRAKTKYHSGGLWTNTACGHPRPDESAIDAATRRTAEEMGFAADLRFVDTNRYRTELDNGMTENEIVHVFIGQHNGMIAPNPDEAEGYAWRTTAEIQQDMAADPENFTYWFRKYVQEFLPGLI